MGTILCVTAAQAILSLMFVWGLRVGEALPSAKTDHTLMMHQVVWIVRKGKVMGIRVTMDSPKFLNGTTNTV